VVVLTYEDYQGEKENGLRGRAVFRQTLVGHAIFTITPS
jgi:hypothetical protein